jgi:hypothetical protein
MQKKVSGTICLETPVFDRKGDSPRGGDSPQGSVRREGTGYPSGDL